MFIVNTIWCEAYLPCSWFGKEISELDSLPIVSCASKRINNTGSYKLRVFVFKVEVLSYGKRTKKIYKKKLFVGR